MKCPPIGSAGWRSRNRVFAQDANSLLAELCHLPDRPAVIYADPPYTDDQYSRYYHLYETLLYYDYPEALGTGRYRPDRFRSQYSLKTRRPRRNDLFGVEHCKAGGAIGSQLP